MPGELNDVRQAAELLHRLTRHLYLSAACAADDHANCPQIDHYSARPCCCTACDHSGLTGTPPPVCVPLLHYAEKAPRPGYTYDSQGMGVRDDLVEALARVLETHVHELRRPPMAQQLAVAAALLFAPRSGA
ncbi:hypothetical protein [Streptomyces anulatus]|uniref:hypothetical protein n=1 Tax=Streptomyces anulatus TaxID=1892 RepID=UPI0034397D03